MLRGSIEVPLPPGESAGETKPEETRRRAARRRGQGRDPRRELDTFSVSIERAHLEEDAGKLPHPGPRSSPARPRTPSWTTTAPGSPA